MGEMDQPEPIERAGIDDLRALQLAAETRSNVEREVERLIQGLIGVSTKVQVVEPDTLQRSQGKARASHRQAAGELRGEQRVVIGI